MKNKTTTPKTLVFVGMMGAVSTILMFLDFAIPIAPSFMKFDIANLPALFAGFFLGPIQGTAVCIIKIILKTLLQGSDTAFVGELVNLIASICYVVPAAVIYRIMHNKKGAIIGMTVGTLIVSIAMVLLNLYITFPLYSNLYGLPLEAIIGMGTAINPAIVDLPTMMLFSVFPFNIIKHVVTSIITYLVYKKAGNALRGILGVNKSA